MTTMGRLAAASLAAAFVLVLAGRAAADETYNLPRQFSDAQGMDQWRYLILHDGDIAEPATWDAEVAPYGTQEYASWNGGPGPYGPRYLQIHGRDPADWLVAGPGGWAQVGEHADFAFEWTAPRDGTIHVGAMANTAYFDPRPGPWWCNSPTPGWCEDGAWVSIWRNGVRVTDEVRVFTGRTEADRIDAGFLRADIDVVAGDELWYRIRRGAWQDADGLFYSVTFSYDENEDLTPPVSEHAVMGRILVLSATDDLSGVAVLESYRHAPVATRWAADRAFVLEPGTYAFGYRAMDAVGNLEPVNRAWVTISDEVDLEMLQETLEGACAAGWITKAGICHSLQVKLDAAEDSAERGRIGAERQQLEAFLHELAAQSGKAVSEAAFDVLSADAQAVIDSLP